MIDAFQDSQSGQETETVSGVEDGMNKITGASLAKEVCEVLLPLRPWGVKRKRK